MANPENVSQECQAIWKTSISDAADNVQIKADKKEIQRRIAEFIDKKRKENDELNVQEFCNRPCAELTLEFSCARVDAVVTRRAGSCGHIKVSKVINEWGPQTVPTKLQHSSRVTETERQEETQSRLPKGIEERLANMEEHCNINSGMQDQKNVKKRFSDLNDYILFLEGLFPEYFDDTNLENNKLQVNHPWEENVLSLDEINSKIRTLQDGLMKRSTNIESKEVRKTMLPSPGTGNVQINADKNEIQRRIAKFIARKRKENDKLNRRKYFKSSRAEMDSEFSCARVDAVVIRSVGCHGQNKVSSDVNEWDSHAMPTIKQHPQSPTADACQEESQVQLTQGIEEHLANLDAHLNIKEGQAVPKIIYQLLKDLENRILFLESLSPIYFSDLPRDLYRKIRNDKCQWNPPFHKKDLGLDEINARIQALQESLLMHSTGPRI